MKDTTNAHTEQAIRTELEKTASLLVGARDLLTEGRSINLSAVEDRVRAVTKAIAAATPEIAAPFKEHLTVLVEILETLQTDLEDQHQTLTNGLTSIKRREATGAYASPPTETRQDIAAPTTEEKDD